MTPYLVTLGLVVFCLVWTLRQTIRPSCPFTPCNRYGQDMDEVAYSHSETTCYAVYSCACCGNTVQSSWSHGRSLS